MSADRAFKRGVLANHDVTAVAAFPNREIAADEDNARFDVIKKLPIAFLVSLLDLGDHLELVRDFVEAFLAGGFGKAFVHIGPLIVLAISGGFEVIDGRGDIAARL